MSNGEKVYWNTQDERAPKISYDPRDLRVEVSEVFKFGDGLKGLVVRWQERGQPTHFISG